MWAICSFKMVTTISKFLGAPFDFCNHEKAMAVHLESTGRINVKHWIKFKGVTKKGSSHIYHNNFQFLRHPIYTLNLGKLKPPLGDFLEIALENKNTKL